MMDWYQIISFFFTNGLRIFFGLYLIMEVMKLSGDRKKAGFLSGFAAVFVTVLTALNVPLMYAAGAEIIMIVLLIRCLFQSKLRMPLFLAFFYEIAVLLWEFMAAAFLGILFHSERFLDRNLSEFMAAVWIVRLLMISMVFLHRRTAGRADSKADGRSRLLSGAAIAGLFGTVSLSGQDIIVISEEQTTMWLFFSILILVAIMVFYLERQYEIEKKITLLEQEKNELLMRDYRLLQDTYAANAKLFHDFHNHIEALHRYLTKDKAAEAVRYLEGLRLPVEAVTQPVRIGDEAVDYLINSKLSLAASHDIQVNCNIEYPRHTNIRSVDLVAILGNLLDNALEAAEDAGDNLRFIHLTIRRIHEMLVIKLENGCKAAPVMAAGELRTTKEDKNLHGWGLQSVRTAAWRYDGVVETTYENNRFCTVVTLSFEPVKTE